MKSYESAVVASFVNDLAREINTWARAKGFWNSEILAESDEQAKEFLLMKKSQKIALVMTELAELIEAHRKNLPGDLPGFSAEEEEVADTIIRLLDYSGQYGLRIGRAIQAKMAKNEGRPYKHGKEF